MKKEKLIAALLTAALFAGIGYLLVDENRMQTDDRYTVTQPATAVETPPAQVSQAQPVQPKPTLRPQTAEQRQRLYKCIIAGKTVYQDQPCTDGREEKVAGSFSIVPEFTRRPAPDAESVKTVAYQVAQQEAREHPSCAGLRKEVKNIDARARHRSTQYLTDERKRVLKRMSELGCSRMG